MTVGLHELVGLAAARSSAAMASRADVRGRALAAHERVVRALHAFPPLVAVHRAVAPADRPDLSDAVAGHRALEARDVLERPTTAACRGRPVNAWMTTRSPGETGRGGGLEDGERVVLVAVDASVGDEPEEVEPAARLLAPARCSATSAGSAKKDRSAIALLMRSIDWTTIRPAADVHVADFGVAHEPGHEPDRLAVRQDLGRTGTALRIRSSAGVLASSTAFASRSRRTPNPSQITRT